MRQAERYLADLDTAFAVIGEYPRIGLKVEGMAALRRLIHKSHVIFYQSAEDCILILSVKNASRRDADQP